MLLRTVLRVTGDCPQGDRGLSSALFGIVLCTSEDDPVMIDYDFVVVIYLFYITISPIFIL